MPKEKIDFKSREISNDIEKDFGTKQIENFMHFKRWRKMRLRHLAMFETSPKFSFPSFEGFERFEFDFFKKDGLKSFLSIKSKGRQKIFKGIK